MCIVSKIIDAKKYFALYDMDFKNEILPFEYKNIEFILDGRFAVVKATDINSNESYYISKKSYEKELELGNITDNEIQFEDMGILLKLNSTSNIFDIDSSESHTDSYIEGLPGHIKCYSGDLCYIADESGNRLTKDYCWIADKVGIDNIIEVAEKLGMTDSLKGALNTEFEEIIPCNFTKIVPIKYGKNICIRASYTDGEPIYYTTDGSIIENVDKYLGLNDIACSLWAKESIAGSIKDGILPLELQGEYTTNISREEFCVLAMQAYFAFYDKTLDDFENIEPFSDTSSNYVSAAYELGIISGTGNGKFSPLMTYTREQAVAAMYRITH